MGSSFQMPGRNSTSDQNTAAAANARPLVVVVRIA
jgi:hypothetical protein